jgi:hypothetical protein
MPLENKYELRSREVQDVLSTPPRFLTIWGNLLVTSILIAGFTFLGRYKIARTIKVPVQITETRDRVGLLVDSALAEQVEVNQQLMIKTNIDTVVDVSIVQIFDTTINMSRKRYLVLAANSLNQFSKKLTINGIIDGEAEIKIDKTSLLHLFVSK